MVLTRHLPCAGSRTRVPRRGPRSQDPCPSPGTRPELAAPRPLPRPLCADIVLPHKGDGQWPGGGGAGPVGIDLPGLGVGCAQRGPAGPPAQVPGAEGEAQGWGTWSASWEQQSRPSRPHQPISRGRGTGWEGLCPVPGQRAPRGRHAHHGGDLWAVSPLGADGLGPTGCCRAGVGERGVGQIQAWAPGRFLLPVPPRPARCQAVQRGVRLTPRPQAGVCIPALPPPAQSPAAPFVELPGGRGVSRWTSC